MMTLLKMNHIFIIVRQWNKELITHLLLGLHCFNFIRFVLHYEEEKLEFIFRYLAVKKH